ncbi:MAG: magnesium and cobalt transport protein CorA [Rhodocyclaceae bacterium]|nr:magnesium and cobalt transport protein CorA [Rhodocyclaceae bacterium]HNQ56570.1 magnesium/cobalt transporter CorA [Candidatus Desulfobacillus denitrificans]HNT63476.1 magnesium/cobalt transporter CorA [Candidatus Desulfobacillus denitrificans]
MKKNRKLRSQKTGLAPGALVHLGEKRTARPDITLFEFDAGALRESRFASIAESRDHARAPGTLWLNVHGLHEPEVMAEIGHRFRLHPLVLEDILNTDQRPKVDDYGDYLYIVARFFDYDAAKGVIGSDQLSIVLGPDFVLTFQERPTGTFDPLRERLRADKGQIRRLGADYLAYSMLDILVDRYFTVLEQLTERTEALEDRLLQQATPALLKEIHEIKREALSLRRAIWPLREVINSLTRADQRFFKPETQPYLRDIYDHAVHVIESLEGIRDLIAGMLDIYLSSVSNRVNMEVRILTVITTLFMPAALIAGIFGMNFRNMPLIADSGGFLVALGMMGAIALVMVTIFWRRHWLG